MLDNIPILSLITFIPLLGALALLFVPKHKGRVIKLIALVAVLLSLGLSIWLYVDYDHTTDNTMQFTEEADWIIAPLQKEGNTLGQLSDFTLKLNYKLSVDGLSVALLLLTALVAAAAVLASWHIKKRWKLFYILFLLLLVGMFGVFSARDLFLFFVFFEVTLVSTFFLIGIWGFNGREKAATKFLIYNGIGSALMLIGFIVVIATAGFTVISGETSASAYYTADLDVIFANLASAEAFVNFPHEQFGLNGNPFGLGGGVAWFAFILLFVAFAIKLPIFPFHTWMLKVHAEAPPSIVMIHSGILLKMGAYGLIRFGMGLFPEQARDFAFVLALLGVINIIYGAIIAFRQTDIRLVLAYSSISHMGIVLFGLAALNQVGFEGAMFQMISHGLISALMFLIVGSIYERTGTMELSDMSGLAKSIPFMSAMFLTAGLASLGLPGLSGFVSEFMSFIGLFDSMPIITAVGALGIILTSVYVLRAVLRMTYGPSIARFESIHDARFIEAAPMIALVAFIVLIGVYPSVLSEPLKFTVDQLVQNIAGRIGG